MTCKTSRSRQNSIATTDLSPRLLYNRDEQFKESFSFNNQGGFPLIMPQSVKNKNNMNSSRKRFFLARRINYEVLNEMTNASSPMFSQQQLQVVTLNQLNQHRTSNATPVYSPRNSVQIQQIKDDQKLLTANSGETISNGFQQAMIAASNKLISRHDSLSGAQTKKNQETAIPELKEKNIIKNKSQGNILLTALQKQNIFNQKTLNIDQKGLRYDEQGQIIPRSLVGKPDWYIKKEGGYLDKDKLNEIMGHKKNSQFGKQSSYSTLSMKKSENRSKIKWKHMSNKISKRQVLDQIDLIRNRLKKNRQAEEDELSQMQIDQKTQETRDSRILNKHEQIEQQWQKIIEKTSNDLNRDCSYSMLVIVQQENNQYILTHRHYRHCIFFNYNHYSIFLKKFYEFMNLYFIKNMMVIN